MLYRNRTVILSNGVESPAGTERTDQQWFDIHGVEPNQLETPHFEKVGKGVFTQAEVEEILSLALRTSFTTATLPSDIINLWRTSKAVS